MGTEGITQDFGYLVEIARPFESIYLVVKIPWCSRQARNAKTHRESLFRQARQCNYCSVAEFFLLKPKALAGVGCFASRLDRL